MAASDMYQSQSPDQLLWGLSRPNLWALSFITTDSQLFLFLSLAAVSQHPERGHLSYPPPPASDSPPVLTAVPRCRLVVSRLISLHSEPAQSHALS
jgi:hypothetical protein